MQANVARRRRSGSGRVVPDIDQQTSFGSQGQRQIQVVRATGHPYQVERDIASGLLYPVKPPHQARFGSVSGRDAGRIVPAAQRPMNPEGPVSGGHQGPLRLGGVGKNPQGWPVLGEIVDQVGVGGAESQQAVLALVCLHRGATPPS